MLIRTATAIAAVILVVGCGSGAATDLPLASDPRAGWERVDPDPAGTGGPFAIISWKDGSVGVGQGRGQSGSAWTSDDGRAWTPVEVPDAGWGGPVALVEVNGTLVAVGSVRVPGAQDGSAVAGIWTSDDGLDWERVLDPDLDPAAGFISNELASVVTGPNGLVAAGNEVGASGGRLAIWQSADGVDWVRSATQTSGGVSALLSVADGYVLAGALPETDVTHAAIWFSEDGLLWTAAIDQPAFRAATVTSLASDRDTIVAVGFRATATGTQPTSWISDDGRTWRPEPVAPEAAEWPSPDLWPGKDAKERSGSRMGSVHAWGSGYIAVGSQERLQTFPDGSKAVVDEGALWGSADGLTWTFTPDLQIRTLEQAERRLWYRLSAVTEIGGRVVVVGQTDDLGITHWLGPEPPE